MTLITAPFPFFTASDGTALDAGKVYIGTAGLDPRSNPIAIYWDEARTISAAQPIRTLAGLPAYQGAPSKIYNISGEYSIRIEDKNGVFIRQSLTDNALMGDNIDLSQGGTVQDAVKYLTPEMFGAVGDGATNDRTAMLAVRTAALATGAEIVLAAGKDYYVGSTLTDISGVSWIAGIGSKIVGNVDMEKNIVAPNGLLIQVNSSGVVYDYWVGNARRYDEKSLWLSEGDVTRETVARIPCNTGLVFEQVSWPSGDTWSTHTPSSSTADLVEFNAASGNIWYGGFRRAKAGQQIRAVFESGSYLRGMIVRHSGGYVVVYGSGTGCQVTVKNIGVAGSTASLSWGGLTDHPQYSLDNAEFGIRVYDLTTVAFVINGYEVYRATVSGVVHDIGFGVFANGAAVTPDVSYWSEVIGTHFRGQQSIALSMFGDSLTSPFASGGNRTFLEGSWVSAVREALDYSRHGIRVTGWTNYAVAGENTANMVIRYDANGLGISNVVVLYGGTNDVQGGSALASTIGNMTYLLSGIVAAGRKPLVVIPGMWLNSDQGAQGFATSNAQNAAAMRAALRSLAGQYGALVADLTELEGQILTSSYNTPSISDARKRDRIHNTALGYRAVGEFIASVIAGYWATQVSNNLALTAVPAVWLRNSWVTTIEAPYFDIASGIVEFTGVLDAGTKADGTTVLQFPPSLRPTNTRRFNARTSSNGWARLIIDNTGAAKVYDLLVGDTYITLEGVRWAL